MCLIIVLDLNCRFVMKKFPYRERRNILSTREQVQEKIVLAICLVICLGFFIKIVFL